MKNTKMKKEMGLKNHVTVTRRSRVKLNGQKVKTVIR